MKMRLMILCAFCVVQSLLSQKSCPPHITTIYFDIGNVLVTNGVSWAGAMEIIGIKQMISYVLCDHKLPTALGYKVKAVFEEMLKEEGPGDSGARIAGYPMSVSIAEWLRGRLSNEEAAVRYRATLERMADRGAFKSKREKDLVIALSKTIFDINLAIKGRTSIRPMVNLVKRLRKKRDANGHPMYRLVVLSNMETKEHWPVIKHKFKEFFELFDDFIVSGDTHMIKPERAMFDYALDKYGIIPQESLFFDDQEENIHAAKALGIHAIKVRDNHYREVEKALKQLGIS